MFKKLAGKILFDWFHFTETVTEPIPDKCIIALAPHTSNWDFIIGNLYSRAKGFHCDFLMKKEWFFWPMGILMRRLGGIPVYRSKQMHATDAIAVQAKNARKFRLCITPEGTRSLNPEWKRGFYYIAQKAGIPILLYGIDYEKKLIRCTKTVIPDGDIDRQMREIKRYYKDFKGRHPENFTIGDAAQSV
jgi:1-acyl-sn-glycerol-3-phosphate acyltransferase